MEIEVLWAKRAELGLSETIDYLEREWTQKEIIRLERNIDEFVERIKQHPYIYRETSKHKQLRKGMVDKNNYIIYRIYPRKRRIVIVNFRGSRQKPIY